MSLQNQSDSLINSLNEEQKKVVIPKTGIFLVRAGAGSGKTKIITSRIAYLIRSFQVNPSSIIALTFTKKAAHEMKNRVIKFLSSTIPCPYIGTFHSYCVFLLKKYYLQHGKQSFSILDAADQEQLLKNISAPFNFSKKITMKNICALISKFKNQQHNFSSFEDPAIHELYTLYEKEKQKMHCFDFDDLLIETVKLFKNDEDFKTDFQNNVQHILIDEYQDTNHIQHQLLQHMAINKYGKPNLLSLCVVGDEDQSIYSWRGAIIDNIINFEKIFTQTQIVTIEQNYRSVQQILNIANQVITHNYKRAPKSLWSEKKATDRVLLLQMSSQYQESLIISLLCKLYKNKKSLNDIAILYRSHHQSRAFEEALIRSSIPYKIVGGTQFYDRKEIKDILAYLRIFNNPFDRLALIRSMSTPARGLGEKFFETLFNEWDMNPEMPFDALLNQCIYQKNLFVGSKKKSIQSFLDIFSEFDKEQPAHVITEQIIKKINFISYLQEEYIDEELSTRIDNVNEFIASIKILCEQNIVTVAQFLDEVTLFQNFETSKDQEKNCVLLMTLHSAKGLEFDTTVIVGFEEGLIPSSHSLHDTDLIEEERRLLYVGITRAKEYLLFTTCKYRANYSGAISQQQISRFSYELPNKEIIYQDSSQWTNSTAEEYFHTWIKSSTTSGSVNIIKPVNKVDHQIKSFVGQYAPQQSWNINQKISHAVFGIGTIQSIDISKKGEEKLTILFSCGIKKIASKFVTK